MMFWSLSTSFVVSWRNHYGITLRMSYANLLSALDFQIAFLVLLDSECLGREQLKFNSNCKLSASSFNVLASKQAPVSPREEFCSAVQVTWQKTLSQLSKGTAEHFCEGILGCLCTARACMGLQPRAILPDTHVWHWSGCFQPFISRVCITSHYISF